MTRMHDVNLVLSIRPEMVHRLYLLAEDAGVSVSEYVEGMIQTSSDLNDLDHKVWWERDADGGSRPVNKSVK